MSSYFKLYMGTPNIEGGGACPTKFKTAEPEKKSSARKSIGSKISLKLFIGGNLRGDHSGLHPPRYAHVCLKQFCLTKTDFLFYTEKY